MQVYRRMNIGTAKPTLEDQRRVTHHCLDLVEPSERFTATQFQMSANTALDEIHQRGHRALIVGGTGLYLTALIDELVFPGEWPEIRAELEADDPAADDEEALRHLAQAHGLARADDLLAIELEGGDLDRRRARRDDDRFRLERLGLAVGRLHLDGRRARHAGRPREKLGAVPYALEADRAQSAAVAGAMVGSSR